MIILDIMITMRNRAVESVYNKKKIPLIHFMVPLAHLYINIGIR